MMEVRHLKRFCTENAQSFSLWKEISSDGAFVFSLSPNIHSHEFRNRKWTSFLILSCQDVELCHLSYNKQTKILIIVISLQPLRQLLFISLSPNIHSQQVRNREIPARVHLCPNPRSNKQNYNIPLEIIPHHCALPLAAEAAVHQSQPQRPFSSSSQREIPTLNIGCGMPE